VVDVYAASGESSGFFAIGEDGLLPAQARKKTGRTSNSMAGFIGIFMTVSG
jgi:hypothetical protein